MKLKVKELIEKLQALPEDKKEWEVEFICGNGEAWDIDTVEIDEGQSKLSQRVIIY